MQIFVLNFLKGIDVRKICDHSKLNSLENIPSHVYFFIIDTFLLKIDSIIIT